MLSYCPVGELFMIRRRSTRVVAASAALVEPTTAPSAPKKKAKRLLSTQTPPQSSEIRQPRTVSKKLKVEQIESVAFKTELPLPVISSQEPEEKVLIEADEWHDLAPVEELSCVVTLTSGQVFSWQRHGETDEWIGVIEQYVLKLRERSGRVQFQVVCPSQTQTEEAKQILFDFFRLDIEAAPLYKQWSGKDDDMSRIIRSLPGLRIMRQDPVECLFAFICSSNNNIQRITQMISKLKATYGILLYEDPSTSEKFYSFPTVDALVERGDEQTLRDLGFGYRAPFVIKSSRLLQSLGGREYLMQLREASTTGDEDDYVEKLMAFAGIGRKVADCIGLFSLNKLHAIPVDTHVWQIACREFDPSLQSKKSLTPTIYKAVGDHFRSRFSPFAGWAHSVLFTGDLTSFKTHLPDDIQKKRGTMAKKERPSAKTSSPARSGTGESRKSQQ